MKRYFAILSDASVVSLGLFDSKAGSLDSQLDIATRTKTDKPGGFFVNQDELYRLISSSRDALNDAS